MSTTQIFRVTRAPEASPLDANHLQQLIALARKDSEWAVEEVVLQPAKLVSCVIVEANGKAGG